MTVRPNRRERKLRAAFTLLEAILAVSLSALLIALIGAGMRIYTSTVADRRADVVNAQVARVVMQRIADDLRRSYTVSDDQDSGASASIGSDPLAADGGVGATGADDLGDSTAADDGADLLDATADLASSTVQDVPGIYGNQYELQVDVFGQYALPVRYDIVTANGADAMSNNLLSDPKVVTYYTRAADGAELAGTPLEPVDGATSQLTSILARRVQSRAVAVNSQTSGLTDAQAGEQLMSDQVASIQFAYHDGYDWLDSWDSSLMGGLPVAVSITITISDPTDEDSDQQELTADNTFQMTIRIPTAEPAADDSAAI